MMSTINSTPPQTYFTSPPSTDEGTQPERAGRSRRGIADTSKRWPDGVVTVAIDMEDKWDRATVISAIRTWEKHTPALKFNIVQGKQGDIRISDDEKLKGDWSAIGTDANLMPKDEPTLHLDKWHDTTLLHSIALHEFGHALGLEHEHQHPNRNIKFDMERMRKIYKEAGVDDDKIDAQIVDQWPADEGLVTDYDEDSIMHYWFIADTNEDGKDYPIKTDISEGDKEIIRKLYTPKRFQNVDSESSQ